VFLLYLPSPILPRFLSNFYFHSSSSLPCASIPSFSSFLFFFMFFRITLCLSLVRIMLVWIQNLFVCSRSDPLIPSQIDLQYIHRINCYPKTCPYWRLATAALIAMMMMMMVFFDLQIGPPPILPLQFHSNFLSFELSVPLQGPSWHRFDEHPIGCYTTSICLKRVSLLRSLSLFHHRR